MSSNAMKGKTLQQKHDIALKRLRQEYGSASWSLVSDGYIDLVGAMDSFLIHLDRLKEEHNDSI